MAAPNKKTQEELEQPAKVYQLDAVTAEVAALSTQVKEGFSQLNNSVNALLIKSESQVTPQQLADNVAAVKKTLEKQIAEEVEKIHLEYRPIKENNKWLIRAMAAQAIIIVGQIVVMFYITRAG